MNQVGVISHPRALHGTSWPFSPGESNLAAWRTALTRLVDCSIPPHVDPALFDFHGRSWQLPEAFVQTNGGSAMVMSRPQQVIDERPNSQMSLYLVTDGVVLTDYDGHQQSHAAGDIVVVDYSRPYHSQTNGYEGITITFDKARAPLGFQGDCHGAVLAADSSAGRFLGSQIKALLDHIEGLSIEQAQLAVDNILRFAEGALCAGASENQRGDSSLYERASRLARRKLSDADFGPDELAAALNVSRSKLFRAFAEHGGVQRWMLGERLTASLQTIVRSAGRLKVSTIALQHGFRSEAHFSRAFQKRYDTSPSAALALARQEHGSMMYLDWVETDVHRHGSTVEIWLASVREQ